MKQNLKWLNYNYANSQGSPVSLPLLGSNVIITTIQWALRLDITALGAGIFRGDFALSMQASHIAFGTSIGANTQVILADSVGVTLAGATSDATGAHGRGVLSSPGIFIAKQQPLYITENNSAGSNLLVSLVIWYVPV